MNSGRQYQHSHGCRLTYRESICRLRALREASVLCPFLCNVRPSCSVSRALFWSTLCSVIMFFVLFCFVAFLMAVNAFLKFYVYSFYQKRFLFFVFSCWIPLAKMLNCLPEDSFTCLWWLCRVNNSCVCLNNKLLNCIFQTILLNVFLSDTVPYGT